MLWLPTHYWLLFFWKKKSAYTWWWWSQPTLGWQFKKSITAFIKLDVQCLMWIQQWGSSPRCAVTQHLKAHHLSVKLLPSVSAYQCRHPCHFQIANILCSTIFNGVQFTFIYRTIIERLFYVPWLYMERLYRKTHDHGPHFCPYCVQHLVNHMLLKYFERFPWPPV